ncbi:hypothetical protein ACK2RV_004105 [Yersinia enterocolitica]|uniref:hypothetical protein n=1 Tax=Serratia proteamaculans TaxID=28151 RepID=UPI0021789256|nr:hypothetical protein [Serratia proteamaculans]CAI1866274.1 Uncharacterised protein [Serratia proteamaculans]
MKETNYDAIGRCVVAKRNIEQLIHELSDRQMAVIDFGGVCFMSAHLVMQDSIVERAASLAVETHRLYDAIYSQALEYNRWAPLAEYPLISITRHPLPHVDTVQKELVSMINKAPGYAAPHA